MRIKVLETRRGCEDGFTIRRYLKGEVYDVAELTACMFLRNGWAFCDLPEDATTPAATTLASVLSDLAHAPADFNRVFRPQPTRGSAPQNPATLGEEV